MNKTIIIFENESILILNKPSGIVVHPFDYSTEETLVDFLKTHSPSMFTIENSVTLQDSRTIPLGGIVHKLDRDTSGVMVVAKTQEVFNELQKQFKEHTVEKKYLALAEGIIERESFTVDAPLGRSKKDYKQSTNPINPRGELRPAITDVEVLERKKETTLVKLFPKTGRTHQLRAHMASIGHPIVGDIAYGSTTESPRIMLHAESISCVINTERKTFTAEIPQEFK